MFVCDSLTKLFMKSEKVTAQFGEAKRATDLII